GRQVEGGAGCGARLVQQLRLGRLALRRQGAAEFALGVARAAEERSKAAGLAHKVPLVTLRADLVGLGRRRLFGGAQHPLQRAVEVLYDRDPFLLAALDLVEALLELGGVAVVGDRLEVVDHERVNGLADVRRMQAPLPDLDVAVVLDGLHGRRVRRRAADAALAQLLDERRLGVARRRLAEVLLRRDAVVVKVLARGQRGQLVLAVLVAAPHLVEAVEREHRAVGAEEVVAAVDLDLRLVVDRRRHAAGDEPAPDQVVELELVGAQVLPERVWRAVDVGRPDRLVGVLRSRHGLGRTGGTEVALTVLGLDPALDPGISVGRDARRVGAHIRDQARRALGTKLDAFIQLLGDSHGCAWPHAQTARGVLLQGRGDVGRVRALGAALLLDAVDPVARALDPAQDLLRFGLVV